MKNHLHVGLLWHAFGHPNLGVDALARGNAQLIREAAASLGLSVSFVTLGTGMNADVPLPEDVAIGPHPSLKELLRGRSRFVEAVRQCDIVFDIGEGDSFSDLYGTRRFAYMAATKLVVLAARRPLVLSPQTIGPFSSWFHRAIASWLLRRAEAVQARDDLSAEFATALGATGVREFTDVAFALPFRNSRATDGKVRVAINVSGLLWNELVETRLDYRMLMIRLLEDLMVMPDHEVHLFAHVNGADGEDTDEPVANELSRMYPQAVRAPTFASAIEAKSYLSGMQFVVSARMHASLAAFSTGVPVVPVAYSRKFNGLFLGLGYRHFVDAQLANVEGARGLILRALAQRQELAAELVKGNALAQAKLAGYRAELTRLLAKAAGVVRVPELEQA